MKHPSQWVLASWQSPGVLADGARCVLYCASDHSLITGGEKGEMAIFDLRQRKLREKWSAHTQAVQALAMADSMTVLSASADADMKLWSVETPCAPESEGGEGQPKAEWLKAHEQPDKLASLVGKNTHSGVTALTLLPGAATRYGDSRPFGCITGGADGRVKLWRAI